MLNRLNATRVCAMPEALESRQMLAASVVEKVRIDTGTVSAHFVSLDTSQTAAGIQTIVDVSALSQTIVTGDISITTPILAVSVSIFDNDQNTQIVLANGTTDTFKLKIEGDVKKASLTADDMPLFDSESGDFVYLDLNLQWKASGKKATTKDRVEIKGNPKIKIEEHYTETPSIAHGTAFLSTMPTANLTPVDATDALITQYKYRQETVTKTTSAAAIFSSEPILN